MSEVISRKIIDEKEGNIESLAFKSKILLTAVNPFNDSSFLDDLMLEVYGENSEKIVVNIQYSGYNFDLFIGDFNDDGLDEILIRGSKGRTGGLAIALIYRYSDGLLKEIFNQDQFNQEYKFSAKYLDDYKVLVRYENYNEEFILDISLRSKNYLDLIYDSNGKLKVNKDLTISKLSRFYPVDSIFTNYYEIVEIQSIYGITDVDNIGDIQCFSNLINNKFNITNIGVVTYGGFGGSFRGRESYENIYEILPKDAIIISLDKFGGENEVIEHDFDGDGSNEFLIAYSFEGCPYIAILKKKDEGLKILHSLSGKGYNLEDLYIAPFENIGLLVGWNIGEKENKLDLINFDKGKLKTKDNCALNYSKMYLEDINNDGVNELILWKHDVGKAYSIKIYDYLKKEFKETSKYNEIYYKGIKDYYINLLKEDNYASTYLYYLADAQIKLKEYEDALNTIDKALETKYPYPSVKTLNLMKKSILNEYKKMKKRFR